MATNPGSGSSQALARLAVRAGPDAGTQHALLQPVVSLGSGSGNDVVIEDDTVSTTHARLEYAAGGWRITDLDSTNGTYVGGARLAPQLPTPLPSDGGFRLGGVQLDFAAEAGADVEGARAAYVAPAEPTRIADRPAGFRLPVWLLALILLVFAIAVWIFQATRDQPEPVPAPAESPAAAGAQPAPAAL